MDVLDRGIPWTELILRDRNMPNDLNLQLGQRISVPLAFVSVGFALLLYAMGRFWLDSEGAPRGLNAFFGMTAGFAILVSLAWYHHMLGIIPPVVLGYVLLFLKHRYAFDERRQSHVVSMLFLLYGALSVAGARGDGGVLPGTDRAGCFEQPVLFVSGGETRQGIRARGNSVSLVRRCVA